MPHIVSPVFAKQPNGKIAPHKLIWPAFWGVIKDQNVTPITLEVIRQTVGEIFAREKLSVSDGWLSLTTEHAAEALKKLSSEKSVEGRPVYVAGGRLYYLDDAGKLCQQDNHPAAKPYLWPIAHDVRPAVQSLGARRCQDCHSTDAPFFFADVEVDTPLASEKGVVKKMIEFQGLRLVYTKLFAFSFIFRPFLMVVALCSSAILAAVLILYVFQGLARVLNLLSGKNQ